MPGQTAIQAVFTERNHQLSSMETNHAHFQVHTCILVSTRTRIHAVIVTLFYSSDYTYNHPLSETLSFSLFQQNCSQTVWVHANLLLADVIHILCWNVIFKALQCACDIKSGTLAKSHFFTLWDLQVWQNKTTA